MTNTFENVTISENDTIPVDTFTYQEDLESF